MSYVLFFLRERKLESVEELVEAGERYRVVHPGKCAARKSVSSLWSSGDSFSADCLANVSWTNSNSYPGIAGQTVEVLCIPLFQEVQTVFSTNGVLTFLPVVCSHSLVRSRTTSLFQ